MSDKVKPLYASGSFWIAMFLLFMSYFVVGFGLEYLKNFIDLPSVFIAFVATVGFLLIAFGWESFRECIKVIVLGSATTESEALLAMDFCSCGCWIVIINGFIGTLIGFINMLARVWKFKDIPVFMSGTGVAIITILYALIAACFFIAFRSRANKALLALRDKQNDSTINRGSL